MSNQWIPMTYFAFALPNRAGELAIFMGRLREDDINLLGMWGYAEGEENPRLSCVPESPDAFRRFARKAAIELEEGRTFYMIGDDRPAVLYDTLNLIAAAGINVDAIECISAGSRFGCFIWTPEKDHAALERILTDPT